MKPLILACILLVSLLTSFAAAEEQNRWSMPEAVSYAIRNSPDTAIAKERIAVARAASMQATAGEYPYFNIYSGYSATNTPMYSFGNILNQGAFDESIDFNGPGFTDRLAAGVFGRYRVYDSGRRRAQRQQAVAEIARAKAVQKQTEQLLAFEVVKNFQEIVGAQSIVSVQRERAGLPCKIPLKMPVFAMMQAICCGVNFSFWRHDLPRLKRMKL